MENNNNQCIILTGGGTAGHVTLNINLKDELNKHFNQIVYIGSENGIEKELITKNTKYKYESIPVVKLERKKIFKNLLIPIKLSRAVKQAEKIIKQYNPKVIFSKGGYVGLPVVIAGKNLGIPVVCHESDITMGLANKLAKKYANIICTNFESTAKQHGKKCVYTGMPLKLSPLTREQAKNKLNIKTNKPILLVTGGSLGSKALNKFVFENLEYLTKKFYVVHLVGKNNLNKNLSNPNYKQIEFCNDMWTLFKITDYAISRAGANTIVELLSNNILTIFVPLPKGVSRGDQVDNAIFLEKNHLSCYIKQNELNLQKLQKTLTFIENNANLIKKSIKNANFNDGTNSIVNIILKEKIS